MAGMWKWMVASVVVLALVACGSPAEEKETSSNEELKPLSSASGEAQGGGSQKAPEGAEAKADETPAEPAGGKVEGLAFDARELGVEIMPGAKLLDEEGSSLEMSSAESGTYVAAFSTEKSPEEVIAFYEGKLKDANAVKATTGGMVTGSGADGRQVTILVGVDEESKQTRIGITAVKAKN